MIDTENEDIENLKEQSTPETHDDGEICIEKMERLEPWPDPPSDPESGGN